MADTYLTLDQLNILFQDTILQMLGYSKEGSPADYTDEAYEAVRIAYQTEGQPAWGIKDDVVTIRITEEDSPINRQREDSYSQIDDVTLNEAESYTRVVNLFLAIYGPNSWENAQVIRDLFFRDSFRWVLSQNKIFLIPDIVSPRRIPEVFAGQWWERVDLEIRFNEGIVKDRTISIIETFDYGLYESIPTLVDVGILANDTEWLLTEEGNIILT